MLTRRRLATAILIAGCLWIVGTASALANNCRADAQGNVQCRAEVNVPASPGNPAPAGGIRRSGPSP